LRLQEQQRIELGVRRRRGREETRGSERRTRTERRLHEIPPLFSDSDWLVNALPGVWTDAFRARRFCSSCPRCAVYPRSSSDESVRAIVTSITLCAPRGPKASARSDSTPDPALQALPSGGCVHGVVPSWCGSLSFSDGSSAIMTVT